MMPDSSPSDRGPLDLPDACGEVRRSCAAVVRYASFVEVDDGRLDAVAEVVEHLLTERPHPADRPPALRPWDEVADTATLVLALDAINFGSGYHDVVRKRPGMSGARTMAAALEEYVGWTGPLDPARLRAITPTDCSSIFGQELDGGALEELMRRFATALVDLGDFLAARDGTAALLDALDRSAERLAVELTAMPFYRDVDQHPAAGRVVFLKRAQITGADLERRCGPGRFDDLDRLTAFADNLVPHVLRVDGVLRYDPALADRIDRGERLEPGSSEEIEIRAAGVEVVERIAARTGRRPMDIDAVLWERGGAPEYKRVRRHRARSVAY